MRKVYFVVLVLGLLVGCRQEKLVGIWQQPIIGQEPQMQGFLLRKDGTASSVNMQTLLYETWEKKGKYLVLSGKSVGNGQTILIKEEYEFNLVDDDHLELKMGHVVSRFVRKSNKSSEM